ncbi:MAG TPA: hypothetical protein VF452_01170, partial [Candidatus Binatia bacterium]
SCFTYSTGELAITWIELIRSFERGGVIASPLELPLSTAFLIPKMIAHSPKRSFRSYFKQSR